VPHSLVCSSAAPLPPLRYPFSRAWQGADAVEAASTTHSVAAVEAAADEFIQPLVQITAQLRQQCVQAA
jgi:hypothetical protein